MYSTVAALWLPRSLQNYRNFSNYLLTFPSASEPSWFCCSFSSKHGVFPVLHEQESEQLLSPFSLGTPHRKESVASLVTTHETLGGRPPLVWLAIEVLTKMLCYSGAHWGDHLAGHWHGTQTQKTSSKEESGLVQKWCFSIMPTFFPYK